MGFTMGWPPKDQKNGPVTSLAFSSRITKAATLMAVRPSNHKISLQQLGLELHFVDVQQVYAMFNDCDPGAVPTIAQAYNMNAIYDETCDAKTSASFVGQDSA